MRSIKANFRKQKNISSSLSDLVNFAKSINGCKYTKKVLHENFNKLVDSEDYNHLTSNEKKELMKWIESLNKVTEEG